ncbi:SDR family NAD(P)-dependent oxidoreductase [Novosphingobium pokkalii]|uniref:SDR family NAD(P)-dependent oxidoreductase n=1 Tax=Novosphingobium pokkalii TaxID=1770194 RepID=UPI003638BD75
MAFELDNVVAVVTGAGGGIGREVVRAMKAAGATVVATDVAAPDRAEADHVLAHDVTSEADWQAVAELVQGTYGRLDALVNVAGISIVASIEETPLEEWRRINAVNVESVVIGVQTLLPLLKQGARRAPAVRRSSTFPAWAGSGARRSTAPIAPARRQ